MCNAYVITENNSRRSRWFLAFGVTRLPVKHTEPRWQEVPDLFGQPKTILAYDLDASRLPQGRVAKTAAYLGRSVDNHPIPALGCEVVEYEDNETAESSLWRKRPFSFLGAKTGAIPNYA